MLDIGKVSYFYTTATDRPGEGAGVLRVLSDHGVNLRAFSATPMGPDHTHFVLFPERPEAMVRILQDAGLLVSGPHHALLVEGEDEIGALEGLYRTLQERGIHVYSSLAIGSRGRFGCILYLKPSDLDPALDALANGQA
jgi:hypothetical protein